MCIAAGTWRSLRLSRIQHRPDVTLQFAPACYTGVFVQHNFAGVLADANAQHRIHFVQGGDDIIRMLCHQDGIAMRQQRIEAIPTVADDRRAAGGGFEQTHAGRPAGADHVGARDVQREALAAIECDML